MGKIKTRLIKRTAKALMEPEKGLEFSDDFEHNKKVLGKEMPSKKTRNKIAGYISRLKDQQNREKQKVEESIKAVKKE